MRGAMCPQWDVYGSDDDGEFVNPSYGGRLVIDGCFLIQGRVQSLWRHITMNFIAYYCLSSPLTVKSGCRSKFTTVASPQSAFSQRGGLLPNLSLQETRTSQWNV